MMDVYMVGLLFVSFASLVALLNWCYKLVNE